VAGGEKAIAPIPPQKKKLSVEKLSQNLFVVGHFRPKMQDLGLKTPIFSEIQGQN